MDSHGNNYVKYVSELEVNRQIENRGKVGLFGD